MCEKSLIKVDAKIPSATYKRFTITKSKGLYEYKITHVSDEGKESVIAELSMQDLRELNVLLDYSISFESPF